MKKLVWVAGLLLVLAFLFPNGLPIPAVAPAPPDAPVAPAGPTDAKLVEILTPAAAEDLSRIAGIYDAMKTILTRDKGELVNTTEKWSLWHTNTLTRAVDTPGKYPGLDEAIEAVFAQAVGTDDVLPANVETRAKLISACDIILNSVAAVK
jgi:hypothetical protein